MNVQKQTNLKAEERRNTRRNGALGDTIASWTLIDMGRCIFVLTQRLRKNFNKIIVWNNKI